MNWIVRLLLNAVAVLLLSYLLPGIAVSSFWSALIVAVVLAILNAIIKPILIVITIPITLLTLGLFLLVINAFIILMADSLIGGFEVNGFWWALLFSLIMSFFNSMMGKDKKE
jgi:putative membrane protein